MSMGFPQTVKDRYQDKEGCGGIRIELSRDVVLAWDVRCGDGPDDPCAIVKVPTNCLFHPIHVYVGALPDAARPVTGRVIYHRCRESGDTVAVTVTVVASNLLSLLTH